MSNWLSGLRRFGSLSLIACAALIASSGLMHAQSFAVTNLTNNTANTASFPDMVVDGKGNTYLAWVDPVQGGIVVSSQFDGTRFNKQYIVQTAVLPAFQPQMAVYLNAGPTPIIELVWASVHPASSPTTYDVFASRLENVDGSFTTTAAPISTSPATPVGVPLADSPRLAFDTSGKVNVVWGQTGVWINQAQDGLSFPAPISLLNPPTLLPNTGGPRIAVDSFKQAIYVAWTDVAGANVPNSYCLGPAPGAIETATSGGNFWMNETPANTTPTALNTRNLSDSDWKGPSTRFPFGFFGCSFDNLSLFSDGTGRMHLIWSDETPIPDILTSEWHGTDANGFTVFSFPINLASFPAASPQVAVDKNGSFYVAWSGAPNAGGISDGIFFNRSDDGGSTFTTDINVAPPNTKGAYPQIGVDGNGNVSIAWEQIDQLSLDGNSTFHVFFAHSTDRGNTFPTVLEVSANPSNVCFSATNPESPLCGRVQLGVDATSTPNMAWVSQASGTTVADIDFATTNLTAQPASDFSLSTTTSSQGAPAGQTTTFTVNATATGGFSGTITLGCSNFIAVPQDASVRGLTCSFSPATITPGASSTVSIALSAAVPQGLVNFAIDGTSGGTTHRIVASMNVTNSNSPGSVSPTSASLTATNNTAKFTVTVNQASLSGTVTFFCADGDTGAALPSWLSCTFNPPQIDTTQGTTTDSLTITRVGTPTSSILVAPPSSRNLPEFGRPMAMAMALTTISLMAMLMLAMGRRRDLTRALVLRGFVVMTLTVVLAAGLVSCGGSTSKGATGTTSSGGTTSGTGTGGGTTGGTGGGTTGGSGGGTGGSGGGTGGTGGGSSVTAHVAVIGQSGTSGPMNLGTVTITAQ